jgi:N-acetylglucosamine-6-phosphate deacetylase
MLTRSPLNTGTLRVGVPKGIASVVKKGGLLLYQGQINSVKRMNETKDIKALHFETGKPVSIKIKNGLIDEISERLPTAGKQNLLVAPGFIDNQINGYKSVDFSDLNLTTEKMQMAVESIRYDGVTTFFPTIITNSHENLLRIFRNLAEALKDDEIRSSVPGFHLEGPYISSEEGYYGCHPSGHIRKPSWEEFAHYQDAAGGNIRQVTIAPEVEGCIDFIDNCIRNNIVVAIGHTKASGEQINKAVDHGARLSTHLGNGCANLIDRHRNPLWPQLANDLLTPTVIADGHHLLPEELQVFYKVKGPKNLVLASDVTHLIGMTPGKYVFLGSEIVLTEDGLIKNPVLNCLAGASMPLRKGVENMMESTCCKLAEAVNMATLNVAGIYNLSDRGSLDPGKRADLLVFERDRNNIKIKQVWVKGQLIPHHLAGTPHQDL